MQKFEGLIAASFTPMNENGEVKYAGFTITMIS